MGPVRLRGLVRRVRVHHGRVRCGATRQGTTCAVRAWRVGLKPWKVEPEGDASLCMSRSRSLMCSAQRAGLSATGSWFLIMPCSESADSRVQ
jgi:hypothetical protein